MNEQPDKFELAGLNFTEEEKEYCNRFGLDIFALQGLLTESSDQMADYFSTLPQTKVKSKTKSWDKKRFYS